jgi:hypothetical protein
VSSTFLKDLELWIPLMLNEGDFFCAVKAPVRDCVRTHLNPCNRPGELSNRAAVTHEVRLGSKGRLPFGIGRTVRRG